VRWVRLESPKFGHARYNADRQVLLIRNNRDISTYYPIAPHQFESLVDSSDSIFYFEYFIRPSLVSSRSRAKTYFYNFTKLFAASLIVYLAAISPAGP
jgi:hypothetical protein